MATGPWIDGKAIPPDTDAGCFFLVKVHHFGEDHYLTATWGKDEYAEDPDKLTWTLDDPWCSWGVQILKYAKILS